MKPDAHETRKAAVYEAALQLVAQGVNPAAVTIQQLADTAGIGKGTVYGYFSSKEEILHGLAFYCFNRENERIRARLADCTTLDELENEIVAYLQDITAERMGSYRMIAKTMEMQPCEGKLLAPLQELREIVGSTVRRLQAAGEIDPALSESCCYTALLSAVVGGLAGLGCATEHHHPTAELTENLRVMLRRMLKTQ